MGSFALFVTPRFTFYKLHHLQSILIKHFLDGDTINREFAFFKGLDFSPLTNDQVRVYCLIK
jgi:hypothetical protein